MTDEEVLIQLGQRLARVRLQQNLTQSKLAEEAGVSRPTIQRLEAGRSTQLTNLVRVLRALGLLALHEWIPEPSVRPMEVLERGAQATRKRASSPGTERPEPSPWKWGDEA